jgi:hypothetical protein
MMGSYSYHFLRIKYDSFYVYLFFFFITVDVRISLRAPRLIFRDPEVNDQVSL